MKISQSRVVSRKFGVPAAFLLIYIIAIFSRPAAADIVFTSELAPDRHEGRKYYETNIVVLNPDTGAEKQITTHDKNKIFQFYNLHPTVSGDGGKIAYTSYRVYFDENLKIWKDWNGQPCTGAYGRPLTEEDFIFGYDYFPSRQYYASMLSHNWNVFIYDLKARKEKQVSFFKWDEGEPAFIGTGGKLMYSLTAQKSTFILRTSGDKRGFRQIILQDNEVIRPRVSPDGRMLAFQSYLDGNWEIYTLRLAESYKDKIKTRLTRTSFVSEINPVWSPDGKTILYAANESSSRWYNYYTIDVATKQRSQLTNEKNVGDEAAYSPDGKRIAYTAFNSYTGGDIMVMNSDGSNKKQLTAGKGSSRFPVWSPDGKRIAYISDEQGEPALYIMNSDGTGARRASPARCALDRPVWF